MIIGLMYHGIDSLEDPVQVSARRDLMYAVDIDDFTKQMGHVAKQGISVVTLNTYKESGKASLFLTFDDGHVTNYSKALPVLRKYDFKAYFFITTEWIGKQNYMTEVMIKELDTSGMIIGSHGITHRFLPDLTLEEAGDELVTSKRTLEEIVGHEVTCFSAPGGRINSRVVQLAIKAGYKYLFDSSPVVCSEIAEGETIGRFAMQREQSLKSFASLVAGRPPLMEKMKFGMLRRAKGLLGNRAYEALRAIALRDW